MKLSQLEFKPRDRDARANQQPRHFYDVLVDGISLLDLSQAGDDITPWGWSSAGYQEITVEEFLLTRTPELESGRIMLFVCAECGDIGCGAITLKVHREDKLFVWDAFGYENNYDPECPFLDEYKQVGPYYFEEESYRNSFNALLLKLRAQ